MTVNIVNLQEIVYYIQRVASLLKQISFIHKASCEIRIAWGTLLKNYFSQFKFAFLVMFPFLFYMKIG